MCLHICVLTHSVGSKNGDRKHEATEDGLLYGNTAAIDVKRPYNRFLIKSIAKETQNRARKMRNLQENLRKVRVDIGDPLWHTAEELKGSLVTLQKNFRTLLAGIGTVSIQQLLFRDEPYGRWIDVVRKLDHEAVAGSDSVTDDWHVAEFTLCAVAPRSSVGVALDTTQFAAEFSIPGRRWS